MPILFGRYRNLNFYYEQFISKLIYKLISILNNNFYDIKNILYNEKFYCSDLNLKLTKERIKILS